MDPERLRAELLTLGSPERAVGAKAYLKSDLEFLGVAVPDLRKKTKAWVREHPDLTRTELLRAVKTLWKEPVNEFRHLAGLLLEAKRSLLTPADLSLLERLLRESKTWAYVDLIAIHVVGPVVQTHPEANAVLDRWSEDEDFWIRRSALLALLLPLRSGLGDWPRFTRFADAMLEEKEFFIRKAIGWVLRDLSRTRPELVVEFLEPRAARASGVTMREGVKYLDPDDAERLMALYRGR